MSKMTKTNYMIYEIGLELGKNNFINKKEIVNKFLESGIDYQLIMLTFRNLEDKGVIKEIHNGIYYDNRKNWFGITDEEAIQFAKTYRNDLVLSGTHLLYYERILFKKEFQEYLFFSMGESEDITLLFNGAGCHIKIVQIEDEDLFEMFQSYHHKLGINSYSNERALLDALKYENLSFEKEYVFLEMLDKDILKDFDEKGFIDLYGEDVRERFNYLKEIQEDFKNGI